MSNSVEIDASKGVEKNAANEVNPACTNVASDVYLALWWRRATSAEICFEEFGCLAEMWLKIREMEEIREKYFMSKAPAPHPPAEPAPSPEGEGIDYKKLYEDLVDSLLTPEEPEEPEEVQIDQHTFVSRSDAEAEIEALKAEADKGPEAPKPGSWAKTVADRKFKQAVLERIREARKMGIGSEVIAQNSRGQGVTGDTVRQILEAQAVDVRKYRKIDEALDRLGVPKAQEETDEQKEE